MTKRATRPRTRWLNMNRKKGHLQMTNRTITSTTSRDKILFSYLRDWLEISSVGRGAAVQATWFDRRAVRGYRIQRGMNNLWIGRKREQNCRIPSYLTTSWSISICPITLISSKSRRKKHWKGRPKNLQTTLFWSQNAVFSKTLPSRWKLSKLSVSTSFMVSWARVLTASSAWL